MAENAPRPSRAVSPVGTLYRNSAVTWHWRRFFRWMRGATQSEGRRNRTSVGAGRFRRPFQNRSRNHNSWRVPCPFSPVCRCGGWVGTARRLGSCAVPAPPDARLFRDAPGTGTPPPKVCRRRERRQGQVSYCLVKGARRQTKIPDARHTSGPISGRSGALAAVTRRPTPGPMYVTGAVVSPDSDLQLLSECVGSEMEKAPGILSHRWRELRQLHNVLWRPVAAWSRKSSFRLWSSRWETRCGEAVRPAGSRGVSPGRSSITTAGTSRGRQGRLTLVKGISGGCRSA